jgi:hypothetical protein
VIKKDEVGEIIILKKELVMPTRYTEDIEKGIDFKEFALHCARAFNACASMRDDPLDKEISTFNPSNYYKEWLEEAKESLKEFKNFDSSDFNRFANEKFRIEFLEYEQNIKKCLSLKDKYNDMLRQVRDWDPPTIHHYELKSFMIEQIEQSIIHDCYYSQDAPKLLSAEEWANNELREILHDIEYYTEEYEEETERINKNNKWITQLKNSLNDLK